MKKIPFKIRVTFIVFFLLGIAGCNKVNNGDVLVQYLELRNAHKVDQIMELYHNDAVLYIPGQDPITDIRQIEAWDAAIGCKTRFSDWMIAEDTIVVGRIVEKNRWFIKGGVSEVEYLPGSRYIFRDGKIIEVRLTEMILKSQQDVGTMFSELMEWAQKNRPVVLQGLMPEGLFDLNESNVDDWFQLLDDWQKSKK